MEEQLASVVAYIKQAASQGITQPSIENQLLQSGWSQAVISQAFQQASIASLDNPALSQINYSATNQFRPPANPLPTTRGPHQTRNGVLWILSGFLLLIGGGIISAIAAMASINSHIINILTILMSGFGVILIPVGIIVGIIILTRHK